MRYFEICVSGRDGFTIYVKTNKELPDDFDDTILELAGAEGHLSPYEIEKVSDGGGFVEEHDANSLDDTAKITALEV